MGVDDKDAEALEIVVPGGAQGQSIADALTFLVGTGDHIEGEIGSSSGHRTDYGIIEADFINRRTQAAEATNQRDRRQIFQCGRDRGRQRFRLAE